VADTSSKAAPSTPARRVGAWRSLVQEAWELGPAGLAFRVRWELALRSGWLEITETPPRLAPRLPSSTALVGSLPFTEADDVAVAMAGRIDRVALEGLARRARDGALGRIRCFGRWTADFGFPIDWHLNPTNGQRWDPGIHWTGVLKDTGRAGDVKLTWEAGRFPHAYDMARASALGLLPPADAARALGEQIAGFVRDNPYGRGVHWASGQETVIRLVAWLFAVSALRQEPGILEALPEVTRHLHEGAVHLERHIDYARKSVYNNHLISEALGLYLAGALLPEVGDSARWTDVGLGLLDEQADRQVYRDGAYIMYSHNYHRAAMQMYLLAASVRRMQRRDVPLAWRSAMERSLDFFVAHQNPRDGRLPNYGRNDGALPAVLSTCDYSDFRPFLQALSLAARGERIYEAGPWDEEAVWLLGPSVLAQPLRKPSRTSVSFAETGYHVARGRDPATFACFRCGTVKSRFTQIDMLHVDVFWRGENVLVDGGTYLYNGPEAWNRHFTGGASHNTVTIDGHDQMVHHRRFKVLYPTKARLLRFEEAGDLVIAEGEHTGFARYPGGCIHRRAVLHAKDDLWVIVDHILGKGSHSARLHWLAGPYPHRYESAAGQLSLDMPAGVFCVKVMDASGKPLEGDVASGAVGPRGWLSRYYGEKEPVPSMAVEQVGEMPLVFVSILGAGPVDARVEGDRWRVRGGASALGFRIRDGRVNEVEPIISHG
jgi:hypothetical protein